MNTLHSTRKNFIQVENSEKIGGTIRCQVRTYADLLPAPLDSVLYIRFMFRSQFKLLSQFRCQITLRIESGMISIDGNVPCNIMRKVINVY